MSKRRPPQDPQAPLTARAEAVRHLNRIEEDQAFVGRTEVSGDLDAREARQATDYVAGVTRWRRWFDFLLQQFYRGDLEAMEPTLRQILRVGLYDLLILETPPHASINEAVELAKTMVRRGAGGLVNGILRAVQRQRGDLPTPPADDRAEALAVQHSHPTWLVLRWLERFGPEETEALLRWNNARPTFGVRPNLLRMTMAEFTRRLDEIGAEWEASPFLDDFVRMQSLQAVVRAGWLEQGLCAVQDESAGLVVRLLDPQPGETILDGCAAPGGKTIYAATRMNNTGTVRAYDLHAGRTRLIQQAADAHGLTIVQAATADLRNLARHEAPPRADRVLLDVPCSGLGVLSKRADLRWQRSAEEVEELVDLQDELLDAAAHLVRPGGLLVYSTCTIAPEENQQRIAAFLQRHGDFRQEPATGFVPDAVTTPEGYLTTLPQRHHIDGAFGARLRRTG